MHVLTWQEGPIGRIRLNRPKAINALTPQAITAVSEAVRQYSDDPSISAIALDGAGERGLCSGADVRTIRAEILEHGVAGAADFWKTEYALNAYISNLEKPFAAFMDGIVMGGGVGLSTYGSIRVTTPRTKLAMPETGIGLFPDVGAMYYLSRAPREMGTHMALTGAPVSGGDAVIAGFADGLIAEDGWEDLLVTLAEEATGSNKEQVRDAVLTRVGATTQPEGDLASAPWLGAYAGDDPSRILQYLADSPHEAANQAGQLIASRSPLSVAVTLAALRRARDLPDLEAVLEQDLRLAMRFTQSSDFLEGVRAVLVDKDHSPRWRHSHVREVSAETISRYLD